jgi:hypothetical protein
VCRIVGTCCHQYFDFELADIAGLDAIALALSCRRLAAVANEFHIQMPIVTNYGRIWLSGKTASKFQQRRSQKKNERCCWYCGLYMERKCRDWKVALVADYNGRCLTHGALASLRDEAVSSRYQCISWRSALPEIQGLNEVPKCIPRSDIGGRMRRTLCAVLKPFGS